MRGHKIDSKKEYLLIVGLVLAALALIAIAAIPKWRGKFRGLFLKDERKILAVVEGKLNDSYPAVKILKVQSKDEISIEVYSLDNEGSPKDSLGKYILGDHRDAFVMIQGNSSNLALVDIDKDGSVDVVAPTYDDQMLPHLNTFRFSAEQNGLIPLSNESQTQ